ncbi:MAG: RNA-binding S4 domain-containing protein [Chitinophagales bacterium]
METIKLKKEFIQLNQLLKLMGWAMSGGEANQIIDDGLVKVNDKVELRRRNKLYKDFEIEFNGEKVILQ